MVMVAVIVGMIVIVSAHLRCVAKVGGEGNGGGALARGAADR